MKQPQAEQKLKALLEERWIQPIYNTASEYKEGANILLNVLHRETSIPKSQIVSYLNNRRGFDYITTH